MIKKFLIIGLLIGMTGCFHIDEKNKIAFIKKYGSTDVNICNEAGFLENRYFSDKFGKEVVYLVKNNADNPIRCNTDNVNINVNETVATGAFSGNVN